MGGKRTRILLADDHLVVRMGIAAIISLEKDMEVVGETDNGEDAVRLARDLKPDIVLMDLMMSKMSGVEATAETQKLDSPPKVLVLTTFGTSADIRKVIDAGAMGTLVKTSSQTEIIGAIRAVAAGKRVMSKEIENGLKAAGPMPKLSARQLEILNLVARGFSNHDISHVVGIGVNGVKDHLKNIYAILEVSSRTEAATLAVNLGLITI